jgi:hypothetical protein
MDVPPPTEEDEGADLPLEADDEDIRRTLRRRRSDPEEEAAVERVVDAVHQMRLVKKRHTAPHHHDQHRPSIEEVEKSHRLLPRELDISLEKAMIRPILCAMQVSDVLLLAKAMRAVRALLWTDDDMWGLWWHRDFMELRRDIPPQEWLPSWIENNSWIDALAKGESSSPQLVRLAKMPWRRWYQWSEFFRRCALWHCAAMQNRITRDWFEVNPGNPEEDDAGYPRPMNVYDTGKVSTVSVPRFSENPGFTRGLVLVGSDRRIFFVSELYENESRPTIDAIATDASVAAAHSPTHWFLHYAEREMHSQHGAKQGLGTFGAAILRSWRGIRQDKDRFKKLLDERLISADLLLGGTTEMGMGPEVLNIDYAKVMTLYCEWYAMKANSITVLPPFRDVHGFAFLLNRTLDEVTIELARTLPPFPAIGGVWFVGKKMGPVAPICGGCNTETAHRIRCTKCGQGYCGQPCHERNWEKKCGDCVPRK